MYNLIHVHVYTCTTKVIYLYHTKQYFLNWFWNNTSKLELEGIIGSNVNISLRKCKMIFTCESANLNEIYFMKHVLCTCSMHILMEYCAYVREFENL